MRYHKRKEDSTTWEHIRQELPSPRAEGLAKELAKRMVGDLRAQVEFTLLRKDWQEIIAALRQAQVPEEPIAYGVRNEQGYWTAIYRQREIAEQVAERGLHLEEVVPLSATKDNAGGQAGQDRRLTKFQRRIADTFQVPNFPLDVGCEHGCQILHMNGTRLTPTNSAGPASPAPIPNDLRRLSKKAVRGEWKVTEWGTLIAGDDRYIVGEYIDRPQAEFIAAAVNYVRSRIAKNRRDYRPVVET
jgi:hypothetical protein